MLHYVIKETDFNDGEEKILGIVSSYPEYTNLVKRWYGADDMKVVKTIQGDITKGLVKTQHIEAPDGRGGTAKFKVELLAFKIDKVSPYTIREGK